MEKVMLDFEYDWEPFTVQTRHLTFDELRKARLNRAECSHWGPAVYKWEGVLTEGDKAGLRAVLIGETDDLRKRIKMYISGSQERGNAYWREHFLTKGNIRLFVIRLLNGSLRVSTREPSLVKSSDIGHNNIRLILEPTLIQREILEGDERTWIVNRKI